MRTEHLTAFDLWLRGALTREFSAAEQDAVPDELLRLLPDDEDGGAGNGPA